MTMAEVKVKEWGNSLGVIIPREIAKHVDIHKGETIKIDIIKSKRINGFGMWKGARKFEEEDISHKEFW